MAGGMLATLRVLTNDLWNRRLLNLHLVNQQLVNVRLVT